MSGIPETPTCLHPKGEQLSKSSPILVRKRRDEMRYNCNPNRRATITEFPHGGDTAAVRRDGAPTTCLKLESLKQVTGSGTTASSAPLETRESSDCEARWACSCSCWSAPALRTRAVRLYTCVATEACRNGAYSDEAYVLSGTRYAAMRHAADTQNAHLVHPPGAYNSKTEAYCNEACSNETCTTVRHTQP